LRTLNVPLIGIDAYRELADLVYRLRARCPDLTLLATSSVHPRNPIPEEHVRLLDRLAKPGQQQKRAPSYSLILQRWILCVLVAVWDTGVILHIRLRYGRLLRQRRRTSATVILKTWCFGPDSASGSSDFYYGALPGSLAERGVKYLLLCGNVLARQEVRFAGKVLRWNEFNAVPEWALIPLWAPIVSALRQLRTSMSLRRMSQSETDDKFALICAQACLDCAHPTTMRSVMHFYIAAAVGKYWDPKVYVTLYEGQPWEKLAWQGIKSAKPDCIVAGYQHTVVMRHALSLIHPRADSWEMSVPDLVLCLGDATRRMMQPSHEQAGSRLIVFGSHRRGATGKVSRPRPEKRKVLVVPEGNPKESKLLFDFALRLAPLVSDHELVFRCHPLLPFDDIRGQLADDPARFVNVTVSTRPIAQDFADSSVILYRGSSAVFYAVLEGLRPIYIRDGELFDIDPLFELEEWREYGNTQEEVMEILKRYSQKSAESLQEEWRMAYDYVNSYTVPVSGASVDRFLSAVGIA